MNTLLFNHTGSR